MIDRRNVIRIHRMAQAESIGEKRRAEQHRMGTEARNAHAQAAILAATSVQQMPIPERRVSAGRSLNMRPKMPFMSVVSKGIVMASAYYDGTNRNTSARRRHDHF